MEKLTELAQVFIWLIRGGGTTTRVTYCFF